MTGTRRCPALLVSAIASGQGKTTVTAAIAAAERSRGRRVRVFKTGPDFLDPLLLERAAGTPVHVLDLWMAGEAHCRRLLHDAAGDSDLILVEGVMGLHDGAPSSAELARLFDLPVLLVVDAAAMAQTFGALVHGLLEYAPPLRCAGVVGNRVAGPGHATMLARSLRGGLTLRAALPDAPALALPERHLGLVLPSELADLEARLARLAAAWPEQQQPWPDVVFAAPPTVPLQPALRGLRIGIARDDAFAFAYRANVELLDELGARLSFFSPLSDRTLPDVDALWLPGGYPELHAVELAQNAEMIAAVRAHCRRGRPVLAECGGLMYLLESLRPQDGEPVPMAAVLAGSCAMQPRPVALAMQELALPEGRLRGHSFHHSQLHTTLEPIARGRCPHGWPVSEPVFRVGRVTASYVHLYFPSNPAAVAALFAPRAPANGAE